ncbi:MAG: hypothetical protein WD963_01305 [Candidatus Paceibacterota bacterium]
MNNVKIFVSVIVVLIIGVIATALLRPDSASVDSGQYDEFAMCLGEQGALFYGAFWCPACQSQKKAFGNSAKLLPYVECSTADAQSQTRVCIDENIASYPTWEFADETRMLGVISLEQLAEKTSCPLPKTETSVPIDEGASSPAL